MSDFETLLTELNQHGITLRRDGDRLLVADPQRAITLELSAAIRRHKAALLRRLAETRLSEILAQWEQANDPHDFYWVGEYSATAIAAGVPCYDDHGDENLGPAGWSAWRDLAETG